MKKVAGFCCAVLMMLGASHEAAAKRRPPAPPPQPPTTPTPAPPSSTYVPAGYTLAWNDEFDNLSLGYAGDGTRWAPYFEGWGARELDGNSDDAFKCSDTESWNGGPRAGDALRATGLWGNPARYLHDVTGGQLALRGYPTPPEALSTTFWWLPYTAGMISGQHSFAQRYGYWETSLWLKSVTRGQHFAIWLLPTDNAWPPEIDMLEVVGQDQGSMYSNSHGTPLSTQMGVYSVPSLADAWHTIGFLWTPDTMRWTVDGNVVREHANYITTQDLYFLMSWEITNNWTGPADASTRWPAEVMVDYVRVYRAP